MNTLREWGEPATSAAAWGDLHDKPDEVPDVTEEPTGPVSPDQPVPRTTVSGVQDCFVSINGLSLPGYHEDHVRRLGQSVAPGLHTSVQVNVNPNSATSLTVYFKLRHGSEFIPMAICNFAVADLPEIPTADEFTVTADLVDSHFGQLFSPTGLQAYGRHLEESLPAHSTMLQSPAIILVQSLSDRAIGDGVHAARSPPYAPRLTSGSGQPNNRTSVGLKMRIGLYYAPIQSCDLSRLPCEDHEGIVRHRVVEETHVFQQHPEAFRYASSGALDIDLDPLQ